MASIRKRGAKAYELTAYIGYTSEGEQIKKTKTWKIPDKMSPKKAEKEALKAAMEWEQLLLTGQLSESGKVKLSDFAKQWFETYGEEQLRPTTLNHYKVLYYNRIDAVLGTLYIDKITPSRLDAFYHDLAREKKEPKYRCNTDLMAYLKSIHMTKCELVKLSGVSSTTMDSVTGGKNVSRATAQKVTSALNLKMLDLFDEVDMGYLSNKTRLEYHRCLSSMLASAVKKGLILNNPCERADPPKQKKSDVLYLDADEATTLLTLLQREPIIYRTAIVVLLFTGMRRGELMGLEWSDIDFERNTIDITKSLLYLPEKGIYEDDTKTYSSQRVIKVYGTVMAELHRYKVWQSQQRLRLGDAWKGCKKVFCGAEGQQIYPDTLSSWFSKFIKAHPELPQIHLHSLRHSNASLMIAEGVDIVTVANLLGHANANTTQRIYAHQIRSAQAAAVDTVGAILSKQKNKHSA